MNLRQKALPFLLLALVSMPAMADADAEVTPGFVVGQVLTAEGTPVTGAQVSSLEKESQGLTDEQGRFRIYGVAPGLHTVSSW